MVVVVGPAACFHIRLHDEALGVVEDGAGAIDDFDSLVGLLWMIAGATLGAGVLGLLDLDKFLTLLGLLLVVVLTIGIFAVDKRILREFVSAHALSAVAVSLEAYVLTLLR